MKNLNIIFILILSMGINLFGMNDTDSIPKKAKKVRFLEEQDLNFDSNDAEDIIPLPLIDAVYNGDAELVSRLLEEENANVNERGVVTLQTPLICAALQGHMDIVKLLLDKDADVHVKDYKGFTALTYAICKKHTEIVALLLEYGADANERLRGNVTYLMIVVLVGYFDIFDLLLKNGADINAQDNWGETIFNNIVFDYPENLLLSKSHPYFGKNKELAELLLKNGAKTDIKNKCCYTPLIRAVHEGDESRVAFLLSNGANPNNRDKRGKTALIHAAIRGCSEIIGTLLAYSANGLINVDAQDANGKTALMHAIKRNNIKAMELLVNAGSDINIVNKAGENALTIAEKTGYEVLVLKLVELCKLRSN